MPDTKAVATRAPKSLREQIEAARAEIAAVLPKHMDVERVIRGVRLAIAQNQQLADCDPASVLFSLMAASRIGLELNSPLQHAWLIPFKRECTLMIGYRGYQDLARRGGDIRNIEARAVYHGDEFDYQLGSDPWVKHKPGLETDDDKITHVYACAFPRDGSRPIIDVMRRDEVEAARAVSRTKDRTDSPWVVWYGEMARKTVVRRLAKYLPLSADMAAAIELDLRAETGVVNTPIEGIDSDNTLAARMRGKTQETLEELREKMGGQSAKAGGSDVREEPAATATAAPSSPQSGPAIVREAVPAPVSADPGDKQPW